MAIKTSDVDNLEAAARDPENWGWFVTPQTVLGLIERLRAAERVCETLRLGIVDEAITAYLEGHRVALAFPSSSDLVPALVAWHEIAHEILYFTTRKDP